MYIFMWYLVVGYVFLVLLGTINIIVDQKLCFHLVGYELGCVSGRITLYCIYEDSLIRSSNETPWPYEFTFVYQNSLYLKLSGDDFQSLLSADATEIFVDLPTP